MVHLSDKPGSTVPKIFLLMLKEKYENLYYTTSLPGPWKFLLPNNKEMDFQESFSASSGQSDICRQTQ